MQFFTVAVLILLSAMVPGPDFALITKNTLLYSRRVGILTAFGIAIAAMVHVTYCVLGVGLIISESLAIFTTIKIIGGLYLIYLGMQAFFAKHHSQPIGVESTFTKNTLSDIAAFRQGFLCNLLNPKATLFFLALFTVIINPNTPIFWEIVYASEMFIIIFGWFSALTFILSHARVTKLLARAEKYIIKILGIFLFAFGIALLFVNK